MMLSLDTNQGGTFPTDENKGQSEKSNLDSEEEMVVADNGNLRETIWAISPQARERARQSNRKSEEMKQAACIYNIPYILKEKEYSISSSVDILPSFKFKDLLSDRKIPETLRARYINMLIDDMDFEKYLMDLDPKHFDEVRIAVNMEIYCFQVRSVMINHVDRYEKLCKLFQIPFRKEEDTLHPTFVSPKSVKSTPASRRPSRMSFISFSESAMNLSTMNMNKNEQDFDKAVTSVHNHQQYEDLIVDSILARHKDLQPKMLRLRLTQIALLFDRIEIRNALENLDEDRYTKVVGRLMSGEEKNHKGKAFKQPMKMIEGIANPEEYFEGDRLKAYGKLHKILSQAASN